MDYNIQMSEIWNHSTGTYMGIILVLDSDSKP